MSLNLQSKKEVVAEVSARLADAQVLVLAEYRGLPVEKITQLRARARASGVYLRVLKNTLARRAVQGTPFEKLADQMVGPLAYGISVDPVAAAKVLHAYAKENDKLVIKGGAMPGQVMSAKEVGALAIAPGPRGAPRQAHGDDAGAGHQVRPDAERGSGQVRPHPRRSSRPEREAGSLTALNPSYDH